MAAINTHATAHAQCTLLCIFHSNLIFVSLPDESSRMLLKRRTLFFGLTDADMRETENVNGNVS